MYVHFLEIGCPLNKSCFLDEALNQIFHQMPDTVFATIGVQAGFNAGSIVNKIVNDVVFQQIKQSCMLHKI